MTAAHVRRSDQSDGACEQEGNEKFTDALPEFYLGKEFFQCKQRKEEADADKRDNERGKQYISIKNGCKHVRL